MDCVSCWSIMRTQKFFYWKSHLYFQAFGTQLKASEDTFFITLLSKILKASRLLEKI